MKIHNAAPAKRRWTFFTVTVPVIVFLSLVGTVSVLLGLHNRFPTGYNNEDNSSLGNRFENAVKVDGDEENDKKEDNRRIDELVDKFKPNLPQVGILNYTGKADVGFPIDNSNPRSSRGPAISLTKDATSGAKPGDMDSKGQNDATDKSCQLRFGSYCLWSTEHKEVTRDSVVKRMKDQLFVARAYYPTIAKLRGKENLSREMKQNIQEHERVLSEAISDPELPPLIEKKIERMDQTIAKAKSCPADCNNVEKKLRQILDLTEDEADFHTKQSAFLHHLGVQTMPKSHHCLSMRLTVEYFRAPPADIDPTHAHKLDNPRYQQYVIFSRNVLASSVTVNSTVTNSREPGNMVFNVITDKQNFYAMKLWFSRNTYSDAVVHVVNVGELSPSEEFRVSIRARTEYVSLFGHSHFLLPEIFKSLKKVVVLDDDVVVQRDLGSLWAVDLGGKVNGAIEFCGVRLGQLKSYLGNGDSDSDSCVWMSGLNVIDLEKWREVNVTGIYEQTLRKFGKGRSAALQASLLSFGGRIFPLEKSWVVSGLGYDYRIDTNAVQKGGVIHYNGNMKPWLDLGIPKYKNYWKKFIAQGELFMDQCNVNQ